MDGALQSGTLVEFTLLTVFIAAAVGGMSGARGGWRSIPAAWSYHVEPHSRTGLYGNLMTALGASTRIFQLIDRTPAMPGVVVNEDTSPAGNEMLPPPPPRAGEPRSQGRVEFKVRGPATH